MATVVGQVEAEAEPAEMPLLKHSQSVQQQQQQQQQEKQRDLDDEGDRDDEDGSPRSLCSVSTETQLPKAGLEEELTSVGTNDMLDPIYEDVVERRNSVGVRSRDSSCDERDSMLRLTPRKTVLVTGGAGFIGSHTADALLARGDNVCIVDEVNDYYSVEQKRGNLRLLQEKYGVPEGGCEDTDSPPSCPRPRLSVYEGDVCDAAFMSDVFEREQPDYVVHLAARAGVRPSIEDPFVYIHSNVEATTRLLELSHRFGVKHFVFASSSSVYGGSSAASFSEQDVVDHPVSPYAATKKACELLAYTYHHLYQLPTTGLRFFTVYGPRGRPDMAPFKFLKAVLTGEEITMFGDGTSERDYTFVGDIVDGVVRAMDRPNGYRIYNLGNSDPIRLREFIQVIEDTAGRKAQIRQLPEQPGDVPRTCADVSLAERELGYHPTTSIREGIQRTFEWFQSIGITGADAATDA